MSNALREGLWVVGLMVYMFLGGLAILGIFYSPWMIIYSMLFMLFAPALGLLLDRIKPSHI